MGRLLTVVLVAWVAVVSWYLYNPLPEGIGQPWKYNILVTAVRIMSDVSRVGGLLGIADERICLRHVMGLTDLLSNPDTKGAIVTDMQFDGVEVRLYVPDRPSDRRGGLIYLHGGGFIAGSPKGYDAYCLWLTRRLDIVIASVHYRRVPEHPSPASLTDALTAAQYLHRHAARWHVDRDLIGVAGDSAGGNLAAALTIKMRDDRRMRKTPEDEGLRLRFQVLSYPLLQGLTQNLPSFLQNDHHAFVWTKRWCVAGVVWSYIRGLQDYRQFYPYQLNDTHIPSAVKMRYGKYVDWRKLPSHLIKPDFKPPPFHEDYFDHLDIADDLINPHNFPLMADDLSDLPATYVMTAEFDTLRDEGILYAQRLEEAQVPVVHDYFSKGWHGVVSGIDGLLSFDISIHAMNNITTFIGQQLGES